MRNLFFSLILIGCSVEDLPPSSSTSSIEGIRATTDSALCLLEEMGKAKVEDTLIFAPAPTSSSSIEDRVVYNAVVKVDTVFIYRVDTVYIER